LTMLNLVSPDFSEAKTRFSYFFGLVKFTVAPGCAWDNKDRSMNASRMHQPGVDLTLTVNESMI